MLLKERLRVVEKSALARLGKVKFTSCVARLMERDWIVVLRSPPRPSGTVNFCDTDIIIFCKAKFAKYWPCGLVQKQAYLVNWTLLNGLIT